MSPKSKDKYPCKEKRRYIYRGEGHVKMETETGVMWPQAKKRKEHPGIGGGRKNSALEAFEVAWPC